MLRTHVCQTKCVLLYIKLNAYSCISN